MFVLIFWYYTFRKAGFGGQTPSLGRNLQGGLARDVVVGLLVLGNCK